MKLKLALAYIVMLLPSLLIAATFWSLLAPERFYHCSDDAPFNVIPPFAHLEYPPDRYILPKSTVYSIWFGFMTIAVLVPAVPVLFLGRCGGLIRGADFSAR
jgi:hypothetical protein